MPAEGSYRPGEGIKVEEALRQKEAKVAKVEGQVAAILDQVKNGWKGLCNAPDSQVALTERRKLLEEFVRTGKTDALEKAISKRGYKDLEANLFLIDELEGRRKPSLDLLALQKQTTPPVAPHAEVAVAAVPAQEAVRVVEEKAKSPEEVFAQLKGEFAAETKKQAANDRKYDAAFNRNGVLELWLKAQHGGLNPGDYSYFKNRTDNPVAFARFAESVDDLNNRRVEAANKVGRTWSTSLKKGDPEQMLEKAMDDAIWDQIGQAVEAFAEVDPRFAGLSIEDRKKALEPLVRTVMAGGRPDETELAKVADVLEGPTGLKELLLYIAPLQKERAAIIEEFKGLRAARAAESKAAEKAAQEANVAEFDRRVAGFRTQQDVVAFTIEIGEAQERGEITQEQFDTLSEHASVFRAEQVERVKQAFRALIAASTDGATLAEVAQEVEDYNGDWPFSNEEADALRQTVAERRAELEKTPSTPTKEEQQETRRAEFEARIPGLANDEQTFLFTEELEAAVQADEITKEQEERLRREAVRRQNDQIGAFEMALRTRLDLATTAEEVDAIVAGSVGRDVAWSLYEDERESLRRAGETKKKLLAADKGKSPVAVVAVPENRELTEEQQIQALVDDVMLWRSQARSDREGREREVRGALAALRAGENIETYVRDNVRILVGRKDALLHAFIARLRSIVGEGGAEHEVPTLDEDALVSLDEVTPQEEFDEVYESLVAHDAYWEVGVPRGRREANVRAIAEGVRTVDDLGADLNGSSLELFRQNADRLRALRKELGMAFRIDHAEADDAMALPPDEEEPVSEFVRPPARELPERPKTLEESRERQRQLNERIDALIAAYAERDPQFAAIPNPVERRDTVVRRIVGSYSPQEPETWTDNLATFDEFIRTDLYYLLQELWEVETAESDLLSVEPLPSPDGEGPAPAPAVDSAPSPPPEVPPAASSAPSPTRAPAPAAPARRGVFATIAGWFRRGRAVPDETAPAVPPAPLPASKEAQPAVSVPSPETVDPALLAQPAWWVGMQDRFRERTIAYFTGGLTESERREEEQDVRWAWARIGLETTASVLGLRVLAAVPQYHWTSKEYNRLYLALLQTKRETIEVQPGTRVANSAQAAEEYIKRTLAESKHLSKSKQAEIEKKLLEASAEVARITNGYKENLAKAEKEYEKKVAALLDASLEMRVKEVAVMRETLNAGIAAMSFGISGFAPTMVGVSRGLRVGRSGVNLVAGTVDRMLRLQYERGGPTTDLRKDLGIALQRGFTDRFKAISRAKGGKAKTLSVALAGASVARYAGILLGAGEFLIEHASASDHIEAGLNGLEAHAGTTPTDDGVAMHVDAAVDGHAVEGTAEHVPDASLSMAPVTGSPEVPAVGEHMQTDLLHPYMGAADLIGHPVDSGTEIGTAEVPETMLARTPEQYAAAYQLPLTVGGDHSAVEGMENLSRLSEVQAGDGFTQVLARQIEGMSESALKDMGYKGDFQNEHAKHLWAIKEAFKIAKENGYADKWLSSESIGRNVVLMNRGGGHYGVLFSDLKQPEVVQVNAGFMMEPIISAHATEAPLTETPDHHGLEQIVIDGHTIEAHRVSSGQQSPGPLESITEAPGSQIDDRGSEAANLMIGGKVVDIPEGAYSEAEIHLLVQHAENLERLKKAEETIQGKYQQRVEEITKALAAKKEKLDPNALRAMNRVWRHLFDKDDRDLGRFLNAMDQGDQSVWGKALLGPMTEKQMYEFAFRDIEGRVEADNVNGPLTRVEWQEFERQVLSKVK